MKKIVLIDGNNLMFRSYYATAYAGNLMKNSKGFVTNALYGFANMMNKIIHEEEFSYILVAFDKGKTFRHDTYSLYKAGRIETPADLKNQFPKAKEMLDAMGIKWYETDGYEADDIIGTLSKIATDNDYETLIVSSDRDLLQLINDKVTVKLLKTKDYIMMTKDAFVSEYNLEPIKIIDLKGLQGDKSDNIPGVKGIGEKTALKLLQDYGSLENIYVNIDNIKGKVKENLINYKDDAFASKQLATIYKEVPLDFTLEDTLYRGANDKLKSFYEDLEFYSFIKNIKVDKEITEPVVNIIYNVEDINLEGSAIYLEVDNQNYHVGNVMGLSFYNKSTSGFIPISVLLKNKDILKYVNFYTYDLKKNIVALSKFGIVLNKCNYDTMIALYLLNYNVKEDIAYIANTYNYNISFSETMYKKKEIDINEIAKEAVKKAKYIYETHDEYMEKLNKECIDLFNNIEMPLVYVLADMELTGMRVDNKVLMEMKEEILIKIELLKKEIYNLVGCEFNVNSPRQLADILYDKIGVPANKKRKTDKEYLSKYKNEFPVIDKILDYKALWKIYSTYIISLSDFIHEDGKIHTIYNQTLTRTGRLSSSYPNLQNIPTRYEYSKLIRKAFIPCNDLIMSSDYSQIELRLLAHLSCVPKLVEAFKSGIDIHTKTAMEIYNVSEDLVNAEMRRVAKAVNFGILYGMSGFGLSDALDININDATEFISKYKSAFPGIDEYMKGVIKDAHEKGYVKTIMNRKRIIEEINNTNHIIRHQGERIALNTPIQGSSADIIKKAMIDLHRALKDNNFESKMILQIHDELIFDVKKEEEEKLKDLVKNVMENCYKLNVPLEVEINTGINWYDAK
ncbi:MAG: DNA polymerase I [bacterium]|nr:DNA polymerase I [bacterium]MDY4108625.1 DNA polymerase I [Bacilli bacterium]